MAEKKRIRAFTLAELLVAIIISAILILMIGFISQTAFSSHDQIKKESDVYNDIFHGFDLLAYSVRNASTDGVAIAAKELTLVNNSATNPYSRTFKNYNNTDFQYTDSSGVHKVIEGVSGLIFDFRCVKDIDGNWLADSCTPNRKVFHITLTGTKDKEFFDLFSDVMRRN